jgi:hypothetical protein
VASFSDSIKLIIDVTTKDAQANLKSLRRDVEAAGTPFDKLKTAGGGAMDFIKAHAAAFAVSAGTAVAAFALTAIEGFQKTVLSAGKLSDALGITVQDASRLQEVAGDLGIGTDAVAAAIGRMNKTAAMSPQKFAAIGAQMVRNKDGSLDVIKTFENVATALDNIPDPARRAKAASDIFGKGWMSIAELIKQGGQGIQRTLASVEAQKVFSPEQYKGAKELRDNLDELQGVAESTALVIGGKLAESLGAMVTVAIKVGTVVHSLGEQIQDMIPSDAQAAGFKWSALLSTWKDIGPQVKDNFLVLKNAIMGTSQEADKASGSVTKLFAGIHAGDDYLQSVRDHTQELADADAALTEQLNANVKSLQDQAAALDASISGMQDAADAAIAAKDAESGFVEAVKKSNKVQHDASATTEDKTAAVQKERDALIDVAVKQRAANDAQHTAAGTTNDAAERLRVFNRDLLSNARYATPAARDAIADYIIKANGIPKSKATDIRAAIRAGDIPKAEGLINKVSRARQVLLQARALVRDAEIALSNAARNRDMTILARYQITNPGVLISSPRIAIRRAGGGTVGRNEPFTLAGEDGPEIATYPPGTHITPAPQTARILNGSNGGGGVNLTVNVNVGHGTNPVDAGREIVRALQPYLKTGGAGPLRQALGLSAVGPITA